MTLPTTTAAFATSATEAQFKTFLSDQRAFIAQMLGTSGNSVDARVALKTMMNGSTSLSAAYTVLPDDCGRVLKCSGTWTLSFTGVSTLGDGFFVEVVNAGSGTITLDPNSSELIGSATTKTLLAGSSIILFCDGTKFYSIGGGMTSADISAALGYTPSSIDSGVGGVGSFCLGRPNNTTNSGSTIAGSLLAGMYFNGATITSLGGVFPGTWRNVSGGQMVGTVMTGLFQRIA